MNYDEQSVNRKLEELNSQSIKYRRKFSTIAGTLILVTVLSASVIAASVGYGMLRGILDNTPAFDPNRVVPTGFYSVIYNSRGDEAERLVGSNANRVEAKYDEFPQDLVDAFVAIEHLAQPLECKELGYICRLDKPLLLFFPVFWW